MVVLSKEEREKILEKLEKLLSHTDTSNGRGFNTNEVSEANKKIKELTDKYGISLDELNGVSDKGTLIEKVDVNVFYHNPKKWIGSLSGIIGKFYECRVVQSKGHFYFIGFKLDAEVASEVFRRLKDMISTASRMDCVNRIDFSFGAVISLRGRLDEIKREREKSNMTCALMVVKKDTVDEEVKKMFPNLTKGSKSTYHLSKDFIKGVEYGKTVEIFNSVEGK